MKILHIASSIDPKSGGPTRSITGLCRALAQNGVDVTLFVHSNQHRLEPSGGVRFLTGEGLDFRSLLRNTNHVIDQEQPDLLHLHGIWMVANHLAARAARRRGFPYIIAPRGMLDPLPLKMKKWKKSLAMNLYQRHDLTQAAALHATAAVEAEHIRRLGFRQPIIVSPNGVQFPESMPPRSRRSDGKRSLLFLSRIHPIKGIPELVEAWAQLRDKPMPTIPSRTFGDAWHVELAGPDCNGHLAEIQQLIHERGLTEDFSYLGSLDDQEKWQAYRRADVFVLPTHSENFGIAVAEALAAGLPVITTKGTPWRELEGHKTTPTSNSDMPMNTADRAGWWIDIGVESLTRALRKALSMPEETRRQLGANGRKLVEAHYAWPAIATQMQAAYAWLLTSCDQPDCLHKITSESNA